MKINKNSIMKKITFLILGIIPFLLHAQEINYTNGRCVKGDCENGNGTFEFNNGDKYSGNFSNGKFNGRGRYDYTKDFKVEAYYDGLWINGRREDDNATYVGKNYIYNGSYKNDRQNGYATITFIKGNRTGDTFRGEVIDGSFKKGIYTYNEQHPDRKQYDGAFSKNKFNGKGVLTYKNNDKDDGFWKDGVFLGTSIGRYENEDVLKKGDTILVVETGKKYLLSKQTWIPKGDGVYGPIVPANAFLISIDLQGREMPIGYITTTSVRSNSTLRDANELFAKNAEGCKFTPFICDEDEITYKKFIKYLDARIYKMDNTVDVFIQSYAEYEKEIERDIALNNKIIALKLADIAIQISSDMIDKAVFNKIKALGEDPKTEDIAKILGLAPGLNTTVNDWLIEKGTDALIFPLKYLGDGKNVVKKVKDCGARLFTMAYRSIDKTPDNYGNTTLADWAKTLYRTDDIAVVEKSLETKEANIIKAFRDGIDNCLPKEVAYTMKKAYLYHVFKNLPEAGEAIGLTAANIAIKYSVSKEYKEVVKDHIDRSKKKSTFLKSLKEEYEKLERENIHGCLGYMKMMNKLRSLCEDSHAIDYHQEEWCLIYKEVFGGKCDIGMTRDGQNAQKGNKTSFPIPKRNH
jgi:hypothetical protein